MLANVVRKPLPQIFSEFTGIKAGDQSSFQGTGDVKYHLGTSYDRPTITGKRVHLSLLANPSHLEVHIINKSIDKLSKSRRPDTCLTMILCTCCDKYKDISCRTALTAAVLTQL